MKSIKNTLLVGGFFLGVSASFVCDGAAILERIAREQASGAANTWKPTGPTADDIRAAHAVINPAVKGSSEDKLITAVKSGNFKKVEALISSGVDLEARDGDNMTSLMIAAKKGYTAIASKLIKAGACLGVKNRYNRTAFFYAFDNGHAETVELLVVHGAAKDDEDFKELFVSAAFQGNNEMVKAIMVASATIDRDTLNDVYWFGRNRCSAEVLSAIKDLLAKKGS